MDVLWAWLCANIGAIIVCAILIAIVTLVIVWMVHDRKKGKGICSCGGSCGSCGANCSCNSNKK